MAKPILCGVYMVRNKLNGKVYIGQSRDIYKRWKQYIWAAQSDRSYEEVGRTLATAMRKEGITNFEFLVLDASEPMKDALTRYECEFNYIVQYNSTDPDYGYNTSAGFEGGLDYDNPRHWKQDTKTRMKRAKPVFLYDTTDKSCMFYLSGAKGVGEEFGYGKDVMSHTVKRGSLFLNRYYLIPASNKQRKELIEKLRKKKVEAPAVQAHTRQQSIDAYNAFMKAVEDVERYMKKIGML